MNKPLRKFAFVAITSAASAFGFIKTADAATSSAHVTHVPTTDMSTASVCKEAGVWVGHLKNPLAKCQTQDGGTQDWIADKEGNLRENGSYFKFDANGALQEAFVPLQHAKIIMHGTLGENNKTVISFKITPKDKDFNQDAATQEAMLTVQQIASENTRDFGSQSKPHYALGNIAVEKPVADKPAVAVSVQKNPPVPAPVVNQKQPEPTQVVATSIVAPKPTPPAADSDLSVKARHVVVSPTEIKIAQEIPGYLKTAFYMPGNAHNFQNGLDTVPARNWDGHSFPFAIGVPMHNRMGNTRVVPALAMQQQNDVVSKTISTLITPAKSVVPAPVAPASPTPVPQAAQEVPKTVIPVTLVVPSEKTTVQAAPQPTATAIVPAASVVKQETAPAKLSVVVTPARQPEAKVTETENKNSAVILGMNEGQLKKLPSDIQKLVNSPVPEDVVRAAKEASYYAANRDSSLVAVAQQITQEGFQAATQLGVQTPTVAKLARDYNVLKLLGDNKVKEAVKLYRADNVLLRSGNYLKVIKLGLN